MKRLASAAVLVILSSMAAFGAVQDFGEYTLDIPDGWTVKIDDSTADRVLYIAKDDKSSSMEFFYESTLDKTVDDLIEDWAEMCEGDCVSAPIRTDDGYQSYSFENEEGKSVTFYARQISNPNGKTPGMYIGAEMVGKDTKTMMAIRDSFALKGVSDTSDKAVSDTSGGKKASGSSVDDERDANGNTKLIWAAVQGDMEAVDALLGAGANPNIQNKWDMSALMYAAEGNHADVIRSLLETGADINAKNGEGSTALMIAAIHGCKEAMEALMEAGADVKAENNDGKRAIDYARGNEAFNGSAALKKLEELSK